MVRYGPLPTRVHLRKERFSNLKCITCTIQGQGSHWQFHQKIYVFFKYTVFVCVEMNSCFHLAILHGAQSLQPLQGSGGFYTGGERCIKDEECKLLHNSDACHPGNKTRPVWRQGDMMKGTSWKHLTIARSWFFFFFAFPLHPLHTHNDEYHFKLSLQVSPLFPAVYLQKTMPCRIINLFCELFVLHTLGTSRVFN